MYAGTTFNRSSGNVIGVHQKIDRTARKLLTGLLPPGAFFPTIRPILHFEGNNGPDAIKRKSPSRDEPWHYIDPKNPDDNNLIHLINDHVINLGRALRSDNHERAAFEAAWLAHAIVDGLTPAHHYPLNDKIEELWGKPHHERTTIKDKNIIKGDNRRDSLSKNWQYWGFGGIFTAHLAFELGVASTITPRVYSNGGPTAEDIDRLHQNGFEVVFIDAVHRIAELDIFNEFSRTGWTRRLAVKTRKVLIPTIVNTVCLAWYAAAQPEEVT